MRLLVTVIVVAVVGLVLLQCDDFVGGPPTGVVLAAATDSTVQLSWNAPAEAEPLSYVVSFFETGTSTYLPLAEVNTTSYIHDPLGKTGRYQVEAKYASETWKSPTTPGTAPMKTEAMVVRELNADQGKDAGYGWDRELGEAGKYTMASSASAGFVDLYVTDWTEGFSGADYYVASPDVILDPQDPDPGNAAGIVPSAAWRENRFSDALLSPQEPLPRFEEGVNYFERTHALVTATTHIACHTEEDFYALVELTDLDNINGTARVVSWFQLVQGLRLIQH